VGWLITLSREQKFKMGVLLAPYLLFILKNNIRELSPEAFKNKKCCSGVISRTVVVGPKEQPSKLKTYIESMFVEYPIW